MQDLHNKLQALYETYHKGYQLKKIGQLKQTRGQALKKKKPSKPCKLNEQRPKIPRFI